MKRKGIRSKKKSARKLHRKFSRSSSRKKALKAKAKLKKETPKMTHGQKAAAKCVKKLLCEPLVASALVSIGGENAAAVVGQMEGAMSDEEIARACKFKVSDVRAVLNKLHAQGIAVYERTRDKDTGWYYYRWSANANAIARMLDEGRRSEKLELEKRLSLERAYNLYVCCKCMQEKYPFETALDYLFKCPQCGSSLEYLQPVAGEMKPVKKPGK